MNKMLITRNLEVDERGHILWAGVGKGVSGDGLRREAIRGAAENAVPRPLVLLAVGIVIGPAILASGQQLPAGTVHRRDVVLVLRGEWRQRHSPRYAARIQLPRIGREPCHRRPNRHSGSELTDCRIKVEWRYKLKIEEEVY